MRSGFAIVLALLFFGGCDESLDERFYACRELVAEKESREDSMECWTAHSREILENLGHERKRSAGLLSYMERYRKLLDYDEAVAAPEVHQDIAFLTVAKGRKRQTIVFVRENDAWKIDALELAEFWRALDDNVLAQ